MVEAAWLAVNGRYGHTEYMCNHCNYLSESPYSVCYSCKRKMINGIKATKVAINREVGDNMQNIEYPVNKISENDEHLQ